MKKIIVMILMIMSFLLCLPAVSFSIWDAVRDADNDRVWDYDKGGTDKDLDNDGASDY